MTSTIERPATLPERIPAWAIHVDLTPREVVQGRQTKVVQRLVLLALVVVLLGCAGLTLLAYDDRSSAREAYTAAQQQTVQLQEDSRSYDGIVTMTRVRDDTAAKVSQLMTQDVDFVNLMARIRAAVPPNVTIGNLAVLLAPDQSAADGATTGGTTAGQDDSTTIGTITISGGGSRIKALAPFVAKLNHMKGITDVVPTSTTQTDTGMAYTLTMNFDTELYTHRFDPAGAQ